MDTNKLKPITVSDYREWCKSHGIKVDHLTDEKLTKALDIGNKYEQQFYDRRESARQSGRAISVSFLD